MGTKGDVIDDVLRRAEELLSRSDPRDFTERFTDAVLDALAARVPSVCPSGFDWTAGDIEDWLRAVKEGRA